jgi:hypothetical protein
MQYFWQKPEKHSTMIYFVACFRRFLGKRLQFLLFLKLEMFISVNCKIEQNGFTNGNNKESKEKKLFVWRVRANWTAACNMLDREGRGKAS